MDVECSYPENPTAKTESDLRQCAHDDQNSVTHLTLSVDGSNVENLTRFRTDSPLFNFTTPENGIFDLHSANSQAVSDGFFVMFETSSSWHTRDPLVRNSRQFCGYFTNEPARECNIYFKSILIYNKIWEYRNTVH